MLVQLRNKLIVAGAGALFAAVAWGQCKTQAQPNYKDRAEYDLIESIKKETDASKKLALLDQWKKNYPATELAQARGQLFITTYQQLGKPKEMVGAAKEMVADDPCSLLGLYFINVLTVSMADSSPEALDTGEKAANSLISNLDNIFAESKRGTNTAEAWAKERGNMEALAHRTLGWAALARKQNEVAEKEFTRVLQLTPNDTQASYWLGTAIVSQKNPAKQATAIFMFARAAAYEGEGATLPAPDREKVRAYVEKIYVTYHGDKQGLEELLATAKTNALPPEGGVKIKSVVDKQKEEQDEAEKLAHTNPKLATFLAIKKGLTADDGQKYFDDNMKEKALPELEGKLVSMSPEVKPKELVLGIAGTAPDVTLKLDAALVGKMEPGATIGFKEGVPESFTKEPFMLVVKVEKANITGWKGAPPPAAKKPVAHRKKR